MPIDIFNPDVQREARKSFADDVVGRFRSGYQINGRPAALETWRVTTDDMEVATFISETFDGDAPQEWETKGDDDIEVFTKADSVDIVLSGDNAIEARMLIWAKGAKRIVTCDGSVVDVENNKPHECTIGGFKNKREHEEQGHVCEPVISVAFRLAEDPNLGIFKFQSGSWSLATSIAKAIGDYAKVDGDARASLALEVVEYEQNGKPRKFTKPVLTVKGAVEA